MSKASLLTLHRWLALAFAPLLLLQALTGAALIFRGPLARVLDPAGMSASGQFRQAAVSALTSSAEARFPAYRLRRIFLPPSSKDTVFAEMSGAAGSIRYLSLDPVSADVLAAGTIWRFPLEAALQLHYRLMDGRFGLALVLTNGLALTLLGASGLGFWWPGRGRILKSLAIRRAAPGRVKLRLWHRSAGVTFSVLLLFSAITGILMAAPDLAESAAPTAAQKPPTRSSADIDSAVSLAQAQFPGARLRDIRFPPADRIDINFFAPERSPRAVHVVSVALSQPSLLKRVEAEHNPVFWMKVLPLHTGDSFGLVGNLLLLIEALVLIFLAISGPMMWWRSRRPKQGTK